MKTFAEEYEEYEDWRARRRYNQEPEDYVHWLEERKELQLLKDVRELLTEEEVTLEDVRNTVL